MDAGEVAAAADGHRPAGDVPDCYAQVSAATRARAAEGDMDRVVACWLRIVESVFGTGTLLVREPRLG